MPAAIATEPRPSSTSANANWDTAIFSISPVSLVTRIVSKHFNNNEPLRLCLYYAGNLNLNFISLPLLSFNPNRFQKVVWLPELNLLQLQAPLVEIVRTWASAYLTHLPHLRRRILMIMEIHLMEVMAAAHIIKY